MAMEAVVLEQQHDSRPICGMCVVTKHLRPRMYEVRPGHWRCPVCQCLTINPTDADATASDLAVMFRELTQDEIYERSVRECEARYRTPLAFQGIAKPKGQSKGRRRSKRELPNEAPRWTVF